MNTKHPKREEMIEFLNDEASPELSRQIDRHVSQCQECAAEFAAWRSVIRKLPGWYVPQPTRVLRPSFARETWSWGLIAALVMASAFVVGLLFHDQRRELKELRGQVAALEARSATASPGETPKAALQAKEIAVLNLELARLARVTSNATNDLQKAQSSLEEVNRAHREALVEFAGSEKEARDREHLALAGLIRDAEYRQETRLSLLRQDLETVASMADEQFQLTRQNLIRISANAKTITRHQP